MSPFRRGSSKLNTPAGRRPNGPFPTVRDTAGFLPVRRRSEPAAPHQMIGLVSSTSGAGTHHPTGAPCPTNASGWWISAPPGARGPGARAPGGRAPGGRAPGGRARTARRRPPASAAAAPRAALRRRDLLGGHGLRELLDLPCEEVAHAFLLAADALRELRGLA